MSHYFLIRFEDKDADTYIVRVDGYYYSRAKELAKKMIIDRLHGVKADDFVIEMFTTESVLDTFCFKNGVAQIKNITHP